jgi:hypothetical protein
MDEREWDHDEKVKREGETGRDQWVGCKYGEWNLVFADY